MPTASTPAATPVIPVDDEPATLARLAAIMSDRARPCPNCGGDPHVCRVIGCDTEGVSRPDQNLVLTGADGNETDIGAGQEVADLEQPRLLRGAPALPA